MNTNTPKIAWITGGGTGIGRALALELSQRGWKVAISGRRSEPLVETARAAATHPGKIFPYPTDVTDLPAIRETVARLQAEQGTPDLVVLNAGIYQPTRVAEFDAVLFERHMRINFLGVVNGIDAVLPQLRERQSGHIVVVASVAGYRGLPRAAAYGATKAALINLAESLKLDLEKFHIQISICNPGFIDTPMTAANRFPMPFLMNVEDAGKALYHGIMHGRFEIIFPKRFAYLLKCFGILPYRLYFPIIRRFSGG